MNKHCIRKKENLRKWINKQNKAKYIQIDSQHTHIQSKSGYKQNQNESFDFFCLVKPFGKCFKLFSVVLLEFHPSDAVRLNIKYKSYNFIANLRRYDVSRNSSSLTHIQFLSIFFIFKLFMKLP